MILEESNCICKICLFLRRRVVRGFFTNWGVSEKKRHHQKKKNELSFSKVSPTKPFFFSFFCTSLLVYGDFLVVVVRHMNPKKEKIAQPPKHKHILLKQQRNYVAL